MPNETPDDLGPWPLEIIQKLAQVEHNTPMVYRMAIEILELRKDRDRLDWLNQKATEWVKEVFSQPCGWLVSTEGDVMPGCLTAEHYPHETLRTAIDAAVKVAP